MKAGRGFLRDVPAATTLVRNVKPSMNDLSSKYTFVFWRSLYPNGFDSRYVLYSVGSEGWEDLEKDPSIASGGVSCVSGRSILIAGGGGDEGMVWVSRRLEGLGSVLIGGSGEDESMEMGFFRLPA